MPRFEATTTALGSNGTFATGTLNSDTYDSIVGSVFADQTGTLYVEQSFDGTNWDVSKSIAVTASAGQAINEPLVAPYFRARYVNGATAQGAFRLRVRATAAGTR